MDLLCGIRQFPSLSGLQLYIRSSDWPTTGLVRQLASKLWLTQQVHDFKALTQLTNLHNSPEGQISLEIWDVTVSPLQKGKLSLDMIFHKGPQLTDLRTPGLGSTFFLPFQKWKVLVVSLLSFSYMDLLSSKELQTLTEQGWVLCFPPDNQGSNPLH